MATKITFLGHSAFQIETSDKKNLLIDPWLENPNLEGGMDIADAWNNIDGIILSHGHFDHLGNTKELIEKFQCKVFCHFDLAEALVQHLGFPEELIGFTERLSIGGGIPLFDNGHRLHFVPALHGSSIPGPDGNPITAGEPAGIILELKGGRTLYHTGDTDLITDMKLIPEFFKVDLMMACIGDRFTMGPTKAARAVKWIQPGIVIPIHHSTFPVLSGTPDAFQKALKEEGFQGKLEVLDAGQSIEL